METERQARKPKLSEHLLELKFMQRTHQKLRINDENARHLAINGESQWWLNYEDVEIGKPKLNVKYCPSYFSCINKPISGRMSFGKPAKKEEPEIITLDDGDDDVILVGQKSAVPSKSKRKRDPILQARKKRLVNVQSEHIDECNDDEVPKTRYNLRSRKPAQEIVAPNIENNRTIGFMKPPE
ncbi:18338_t:CDS:2 [Dentiscutata erythropus]|uniref:18338_t:CDS:1 n=1 Tax=Dentiscutata erythropus TaxID=1348616 RepID=A0A9N8ZPI5_9GLOM|nr:18338_t:CDS:2 [Dentiscutata erythropus]